MIAIIIIFWVLYTLGATTWVWALAWVLRYTKFALS